MSKKQVTGGNAVDSVTPTVSAIAGEPGQVVTFALTARNASGAALAGTTFTAVSANPALVRVDSVIGRTVTCSILGATAGVNVVGSCEGHDAAPVSVSATWILATLLLAPSPATVAVGSSVALTAAARNRFGLAMPLPSISGTSSASSVATVGAIAGATVPVLGVATGTASIRVHSSGAVLSNAVALSVTAAAPALTSFGVSVSSATPGAGATITVRAQALDQFGAPIAVSDVVTWSSTGTGGSFASPTSTTDGMGLATVAFTVSNDDTVTHTVTAADGSAHAGTSGTIDVQPSGGGGSPDAGVQSILDGALLQGSARLYQGTQPARVTDAATGSTLLADFTVLATPSLGAVLSPSQIDLTSAVSTGRCYVAGTPQWLRVVQSDGTPMADVPISADCALDHLAPTVGQLLAITRFVLTL